jgi:hypothetical protein
LRVCLSICERNPPAPTLFCSAKSTLGEALTRQAKLEEAEEVLIESYRGLEAQQATTPVVTQRLLAETRQRLVDLYTAWEKPEELAKWQAQ